MRLRGVIWGIVLAGLVATFAHAWSHRSSPSPQPTMRVGKIDDLFRPYGCRLILGPAGQDRFVSEAWAPPAEPMAFWNFDLSGDVSTMGYTPAREAEEFRLLIASPQVRKDPLFPWIRHADPAPRLVVIRMTRETLSSDKRGGLTRQRLTLQTTNATIVRLQGTK